MPIDPMSHPRLVGFVERPTAATFQVRTTIVKGKLPSIDDTTNHSRPCRFFVMTIINSVEELLDNEERQVELFQSFVEERLYPTIQEPIVRSLKAGQKVVRAIETPNTFIAEVMEIQYAEEGCITLTRASNPENPVTVTAEKFQEQFYRFKEREDLLERFRQWVKDRHASLTIST